MPPLRWTLTAKLLATSLAKTTAMMIVSFAQLSKAGSVTRQRPNDGTHFLKACHLRRSPPFPGTAWRAKRNIPRQERRNEVSDFSVQQAARWRG